ncbi:LysR family transcriptional regulator [Ferrovum sp. PN-J185]|uniref:LysR family transcriptional regulator n=1 Tax=Ferrovum sp. PN-J185 TaxID=1356306 RepID=UPI000797DF3A|nr:LysR family transcriptional regulator [Ferrovum sp. PN-J185]KXW55767.1 HTH-type transcriptional regulator GltC [Ferrovum sp. PN-J185]MCC6068535.1 LysR family transcriptional regulator [Ferrovum sp. PN-J185]
MLERIHLAILKEIDQCGSLTAAAKQLHLTQSALSHSIKKLEQQLGTTLWIREGKQLQLTQSGQYLLSIANRLLPQLIMAENQLRQYAQGERGTLHIGMECHPCYQWLLKVVSPYLLSLPDVDVDVKQKFQFGGMGALFSYEIDILVTPDPLYKSGLYFEPVFDYEQVLVTANNHQLAHYPFIDPEHLNNETLITYPVSVERLDIFNQFLMPAGIMPRKHKTVETTDIILQMVANGRGVTALPKWLALEYVPKLQLSLVKLGKKGIMKKIHLGIRKEDLSIPYVNSFFTIARQLSRLDKQSI